MLCATTRMLILAQVLILLPLRSAALRCVTRLCQLAQRETRADSIQHKPRFLEEFGANEEEVSGWMTTATSTQLAC